MSLDQDMSFYCVIDGNVQLYAQTGQPTTLARSGVWEEEDMNGYQLLNQVGSGGTLSSLFTILSLFTENVKISWQDGDRPDESLEHIRSPTTRPLRTRSQRSNSDVSRLDLAETPGHRSRAASVSSSGSTIHAQDVVSPGSRSASRDSRFSRTPSGNLPFSSRAPTSASIVTETPNHHYGVVARAAEDSTLAVIPAEAFQRLTKKFPKAAAHIVQGKFDHTHRLTTV